MTEKRYYYKDYEESYYVFDSKTLSESEFEEKVEYYGYNVFADSLTGEEVVDLLNENEQLQHKLSQQEMEYATDLHRLAEEKGQLKQQLNYIQNSISEHIKHQKTELGQKALREIIEDYNEWLLGHKEVKE